MSLGPRRFALASFLSLFACADLPDIPRGTCGNGVLDPGEDCDGVDSKGTCGAAGTVVACRFVCKPLASPSGCPATFGCGTDETCRRSAGSFTVGAETGLSGADVVAAVDVGGRGAKSVYAQSTDYLGAGTPRLFTFDQRGSITAQETCPAQIVQPVFLDTNADGAEDVVGTNFEGLVFLPGQGDTTLGALAFPSFRPPANSIARIAVVTLGQLTASGLLIASIPGGPGGPGTRTTVVLAQDTAAAPNALAVLPVLPENLGTHAANVRDPRKDAAWGLPVVVPLGSREIGVFQAKTVDGKWEQPDPLATPLPRTLVTTTHPLVEGAWSFPIDEDPHDDLVVITKGYWEVAFGDGLGGFASRPPGVPGGVAGRTAVVRIALNNLGDDGDGLAPQAFLEPLDIASSRKPYLPFVASATVLTVVGPRGVATAVLTKESFEASPLPGVDFTLQLIPSVVRPEPWATARIGDLNGDTYPDVIAGSRESVDVDFYAGTDTILFNGSRIETGAPTASIALGDFDGDRVTDAAIAEVLGPNRHRLAIAYGAPLSRPGTPVAIGEVDPIIQMEVANLAAEGLSGAVDLVKDLGVVTTGRNGATGERQDAIAILRGSGNRLPLAPLTLTDLVQAPPPAIPAQLLSYATTLTTPRRADGSVGYEAIGIEQLDAPYLLRLWSVPALDPDFISATAARGSLEHVPGFVASLPRACSVAVDLNNDAADESVFWIPTPQGASAVVVSNPTGDIRAATVSAPATLALPGVAKPTVPLSVIAGDVDGDGFADLVLTTTLAQGELPGFIDYQRPSTTQVVVIWNRAGTLDFAQPTALSPDGTATPSAATFVTLGERRALVIASTLGLHAVSGGNGGAPRYDRVPVSGVGRPGTVRSLASGDVTGDGVADIVVGVADGRVNVLIGAAR